MPRLPTSIALFAAAAGCVVFSACLTWDSAGTSCDDFVPNQQYVNALGTWACTIAQEGHVTSTSSSSTLLTGEMCDRVCGPGFGNCQIPDEYIQAYLAAQTGTPIEASSDAAPDAAGGGGEGDAAGDAGSDAAAPVDAGADGDAGPAPLCPNALDSLQFMVLCTNSC
jgi:hypothetical protein